MSTEEERKMSAERRKDGGRGKSSQKEVELENLLGRKIACPLGLTIFGFDLNVSLAT